MERTPEQTRRLRQAIAELCPSEEPSSVTQIQEAELVEEEKEGRRGRPRLPALWSRVVSVQKDDLDQLQTFILHQDL